MTLGKVKALEFSHFFVYFYYIVDIVMTLSARELQLLPIFLVGYPLTLVVVVRPVLN